MIKLLQDKQIFASSDARFCHDMCIELKVENYPC